MTASLEGVHRLTAGDVMSRDLKMLDAGTPLQEAAAHLVRFGVHGVPVVEGSGVCVGIFSVSDVARWVAGFDSGAMLQPRTCSFQQVARAPGGVETVRCVLPPDACPHQRSEELEDGSRVTVCNEPHTVPTDWQMVECESRPAFVRDVMSTMIVCVPPQSSVAEVARTMLDKRVQRVLVLDPSGRPEGMVTADDLLQCLAHPEACGDDEFSPSSPH